jgi:transmembrane sensor
MNEARSYRPTAHRTNLAIAAILLVTIASGVMFWTRAPVEIPAVVYETSKGEQKSVVLADGTKIDLNIDTRLSVAFTNENRTVRLEGGEAFFVVGQDESRPFEVIAGNGRIRDIGTSFCVYRDSMQVSTVVTEGLVLIETDAFTSPLSLAAGNNLIYDNAGKLLGKKSIDTQAHIAWREGKIIFKGSTINELTQQIMRYHDVNFVVDSTALDNLHVSGSFKIKDLDGLLSALSMMLPIEINRTDTKTIRLSAKSPT